MKDIDVEAEVTKAVMQGGCENLDDGTSMATLARRKKRVFIGSKLLPFLSCSGCTAKLHNRLAFTVD